MARSSVIESILDLARWAPSGDNTQPWRFEIVDDSSLVIHGFDTRDHCVYDLDGRPSQISLGAVIETISIAATLQGRRTEVVRRVDSAENRPTFDVKFTPDASIRPDALAEQITIRSVQRRPMRLRPLTTSQKRSLEAAAGPLHRVVWLEGTAAKLRTASLMFGTAKLRLTMPEAYLVHREIIEWGARYSKDRIPDQALGVDPATARLMRWIMGDWRRVSFFNRYLAGTIAPRVQMDLLPSLFCAAHFVITAERPAREIDDYVAAGRAMQRLWLQATSIGLAVQPEMTPLIFARYVREGRSFTAAAGLHDQARALSGRLDALLGEQAVSKAVFMGRIGAGPAPTARSLRLPLEQLWAPKEIIEAGP